MKQFLLSIVLFAGLVAFIRHYTPLMIFIDKPSLILVIGMISVLVISRFRFKELVTSHEVRLEAIDYVSKVAPLIGVLSSIIGMVQMLQMLSMPAMIGPSLAVCLLSILYGGMISLVATSYKRIKVRTTAVVTIGSGLSISIIAFLALLLGVR